MSFDYRRAFDRNIGWVTEAEQATLRTRRVAVAGLGGVGGVHVQTLARLGIGAFTLADFDRFDIANFNRQAGATMDTVGHPKLDVLAGMAQAINPELDLRLFPDGVTPENLDAFLADVDVFVDGLDFFALDIRRHVFARCAERGIPAVTAAPIGLGAGVLVFKPGGMTFEQYFRLEGQPAEEQYLRFLLGMAPRGLHRRYLVDPSRVSLAEKRGPSTAPACQLCAGIAATMALKLLLHRGDVKAAPVHHHFDAYEGRLAVTRLAQGNASPVQRVRLAVARRMLGKPPVSVEAPSPPKTPILTVLQAARWTPSGDNAQPWRFEVLGPDEAVVHYRAMASGDVYDYRGGEPTVVAAGMLLETLRIAAAAQRQALRWTWLDQGRIRVALQPDADVQPSPLHPYVAVRSVDRRPYLARPLRKHETAQLEAAFGPEWRVTWHAAPAMRLRMARLGAAATAIRLRASEAFGVHQRVIDWQGRDSATAIPSAAVGLDPLTLRLMRWALQSWNRVRWLNRLTGTGAISAQLDYRPGLLSAAFFTVEAAAPLPEPGPSRTLALLRLGERLQRFWLTATRLGLAMQPNYATMIFSYYGEHGTPFTADQGLRRRAAKLAQSFRQVLGTSPSDVLFLGRIGEPGQRRPRSRSVRRNLDELVFTPPSEATAPAAIATHPG